MRPLIAGLLSSHGRSILQPQNIVLDNRLVTQLAATRLTEHDHLLSDSGRVAAGEGPKPAFQMVAVLVAVIARAKAKEATSAICLVHALAPQLDLVADKWRTILRTTKVNPELVVTGLEILRILVSDDLASNKPSPLARCPHPTPFIRV
jgi:hypothetical protein